MPPKNGQKWGMVFLDSEESVTNRAKRLPALAEVTDVVVMHDAQIALHLTQWDDLSAKYSKTDVYNKYTPWTVVMHV